MTKQWIIDWTDKNGVERQAKFWRGEEARKFGRDCVKLGLRASAPWLAEVIWDGNYTKIKE